MHYLYIYIFFTHFPYSSAFPHSLIFMVIYECEWREKKEVKTGKMFADDESFLSSRRNSKVLIDARIMIIIKLFFFH